MIRYVPWWGGWRLLLRINGQQAASSSAPTAVGLSISPCGELSEKGPVSPSPNPVQLPEKERVVQPTSVGPETKPKSKSQRKLSPKTDEQVAGIAGSEVGKRGSIVAAAFASLQGARQEGNRRLQSVDDRIASANTVDALLSAAQSSQLTRRHALRVVSILADWAASKRVRLADFETEPRFVSVCRFLGRRASSSSDDTTGLGDLAMVLGVTGDDEAAKLVSSISLSQMIRVMITLAQKRRRSTPLLRALASNISSSTDIMDVKQAADVLYAMAMLNFADEVLLVKTSADLCSSLQDNKRPAVVGSVLTSLGMMRYKDIVLLDTLSEWVERHHTTCRVQDLVALLLTLAKVNHNPVNADRLYKVMLPQISAGDVPRPAAWLDVVWALAVLGRAEHSHLASVLAPDTVAKLVVTNGDSNGIPPAARIKLLNINAVAQLSTPGYKGPLLSSSSDDCKVTLNRSREKQLLVSSVMDSLSNLLPSATYLRTNIDTGMGFLIDGECLVDAKCNPLPVEEQPAARRTIDNKRTRVAVLVWDYHDMCRGHQEPAGAAVLSAHLLDKKGYRVLAVPYTEFNPREKVVARVQYLEQRLKALARNIT